jgi:hypothetical protein
MILAIITADSELTFRGVRRMLEQEMGLDEVSLQNSELELELTQNRFYRGHYTE